VIGPVDNPYEPPQAPTITGPGPGGFPPQRPAAGTVFGILNIIFGALNLLCAPAGLIQTFAAQPGQPMPNANPGLQAMQDAMTDPTYRTVMVILTVIGMAASGALLAAGIGLLNGKPWGRTFSIYYCYYTFLMTVVGAVVSYAFLVQPMLRAAANQQGPENAAMIGGAIGALFGGTCMGLIYPIFLIIFMNTKKVVDYYRSAKAVDVI